MHAAQHPTPTHYSNLDTSSQMCPQGRGDFRSHHVDNQDQPLQEVFPTSFSQSNEFLGLGAEWLHSNSTCLAQMKTSLLSDSFHERKADLMVVHACSQPLN